MKIGFDFWIVNLLVNFWKESKNVCIYAQLSNLKMYFRVEFDRIKCREYRRMLNSRLADTLCLMQLWNGFFSFCWFQKVASSKSYVLFWLRNKNASIFWVLNPEQNVLSGFNEFLKKWWYQHSQHRWLLCWSEDEPEFRHHNKSWV